VAIYAKDSDKKDFGFRARDLDPAQSGLTNAYCVQPEAPGDYVVVAGTNHVRSYSQSDGAGQTILVKRMFSAQDYDERTKANDIALIELASPARSES